MFENYCVPDYGSPKIPRTVESSGAITTGRCWAQSHCATRRTSNVAVSRARAAQARWAAVPIAERARIFLRFHDLLLDRQDEVLDLIQLEIGKARRHAFEEILDTAESARHYACMRSACCARAGGSGAMPCADEDLGIPRPPVGVVGFIVPWNYPLNLAITDAIPALMAGNTAVLRPDPQTSFTALWAVALAAGSRAARGCFRAWSRERGRCIGPGAGRRVDYRDVHGQFADRADGGASRPPSG